MRRWILMRRRPSGPKGSFTRLSESGLNTTPASRCVSRRKSQRSLFPITLPSGMQRVRLSSAPEISRRLWEAKLIISRLPPQPISILPIPCGDLGWACDGSGDSRAYHHPEFLPSRNADAPGQDVVIRGDNMFEQARINSDQCAKRWPASRVNQFHEWRGLAVIVARALRLERHQTEKFIARLECVRRNA